MKNLFVFLRFFFLSAIGYFILNRLWDFIFDNENTYPVYKEIAMSVLIGIFLAINITISKKS
jgi:hypothetical protein